MRILDRYAFKQLFPVWLWCLTVFVFLSCLIDLFEHLDEILRYHISIQTVFQYYVNFIPLVIVRASPLALLLGSSFVTMMLSRHQELLAMNASGTSLLRASVPFIFTGWLISLFIFVFNDLVIPKTSATYEQLRQEAFKGQRSKGLIENVAMLDNFNRLYHASTLDLKEKELKNLTVLEHDWHNRPIKSLYASRAVWTKHGWLLLDGRIYRIGAGGKLEGEIEPFVERLISYPVMPNSFTQPEAKPETMRYAQLRLLISRLKQIKISNTRRYAVELTSKITMPLMNLVVCLIGFAGSTQLQIRGNLRGLGISLGLGILYYLFVAIGQGIGKEGFLWIPVVVAVWAPHLLTVWWCLASLQRTR